MHETWYNAGGSLTAAAVIAVAVLLSEAPAAGKWPGVMALLSHYSKHPEPVILVQVKLMMTAVLRPDR